MKKRKVQVEGPWPIGTRLYNSVSGEFRKVVDYDQLRNLGTIIVELDNGELWDVDVFEEVKDEG